VEDVINSACVASPLTLLDCSPVSDGAAAVVVSDYDLFESERKIKLLGSGVATDTLALSQRKSFTSLYATKKAAEIAYKEAGVGPQFIDLAEVHDCFSIAEIIAMEDLGFYKPGEAFRALRKKETTLGGKLPINLSGGLKGCGHPVGATGVKQVVEVFKQLLGEAGARQSNRAKIGLTQNVGGSGATSVVHIFSK
jgi:acetyl-CoA C-acetyltransferase